MGNLNSSSSTSIHADLSTAQQKKRFLITPKRLKSKLRRQSVEQNSGTSLIAQSQSKKSGDYNVLYQSADAGECECHVLVSFFFFFIHIFIYKIFLLIIESLIKTKPLESDDSDSLTQSQHSEQVSSCRQSYTNTCENVAEATTKHSNERAFSHDLTAKDESLIEESLHHLRELIENLLCSDHSDAPIVIEIDSVEKSLKILPHSTPTTGIKEDERE